MMSDKRPPSWQPTGTIQKAFDIAAKQHKSGVRKGGAIPYLSHLLAVSALVIEHGGDEVQAAAALLHDVLEDTDITELKLEESMGKEVTAIVNACSSKKFGEPKEDDPWLSKKRYLERLSKKSKDDPSLLVALADKVHNSESCVNEYPTDPTSRVDYWKKFTSGYEKQKEWYEGLNAGLKSKGTLPPALLNRLDTAIKILFH